MDPFFYQSNATYSFGLELKQFILKTANDLYEDHKLKKREIFTP